MNRKQMRILIALVTAILLLSWLGLVAISVEGYTSKWLTEIAWAGTQASATDEWFEIGNPLATPVDTTGWTLWVWRVDPQDPTSAPYTTTIDIPPTIILPMQIALFERTDDNTVSTVQAAGIYAGSLPNTDVIAVDLRDSTGALLDLVDQSDGDWLAGSTSPRASMQWDVQTGAWFTSVAGTEQDANGNVILGTPGGPNDQVGNPNCFYVPIVSVRYDFDFEIDSTHIATPTVAIDSVLGDGTKAHAELYWNVAARHWWQKPHQYNQKPTQECYDAHENLIDGAENILHAQPGVGSLNPDPNFTIWLNALRRFQSSAGFGVFLPMVTD